MKTSSNLKIMKNTFIKSISNTPCETNSTESKTYNSINSSKANKYKTNKDNPSVSNNNNVCHCEENEYKKAVSILLPTRRASSGATVNKTEFVIVDGITPYIYIYSFCGAFKGAVPTLRAYGKIVYSMETNSYYALDGHCSSNIYVLNCRFEETDKFSTECSSALTGISLSPKSCYYGMISNGFCSNCQNQCNNAENLLLTSPHYVSSSTKTGRNISYIRNTCKNVFLNSFVATEEGFAEAYCQGSSECIQIFINCNETTITIPRCVSIKNLFTTDGGGIYGFFGKNYTNSYILPIYENECINMELTNFLLGKS